MNKKLLTIKKGDTVTVIAGKDKGKKAKVLAVFAARNRVQVEGANMQKKHRRARKGGEKGTMIELAMPMDASNVMLWCSSCGAGRRTGSKMEGNKPARLNGRSGGKVRVCVKCKGTI